MMVLFLVQSRISGSSDTAEYTLDDDMLAGNFQTDLDGSKQELNASGASDSERKRPNKKNKIMILDENEQIEMTKKNDMSKSEVVNLENGATTYNGALVVPKKLILKEIASANYMSDILNSLRDEKVFIRLTSFQIIINIVFLIIHKDMSFNLAETSYINAL